MLCGPGECVGGDGVQDGTFAFHIRCRVLDVKAATALVAVDDLSCTTSPAGAAFRSSLLASAQAVLERARFSKREPLESVVAYMASLRGWRERCTTWELHAFTGELVPDTLARF